MEAFKYTKSPDGERNLSGDERAMCERVAARWSDLPWVTVSNRASSRFSFDDASQEMGQLAWMDALGIGSLAIVEVLFDALARGTSMGGRPVSETHLNAALQMLADLRPVNAAELMLATQIVTMHHAFQCVAATGATAESDLEYEWSSRMRRKQSVQAEHHMAGA